MPDTKPEKRVRQAVKDGVQDPFTALHPGAPGGMDYLDYVAANHADYKPLFGTSRILLVNGKVGC
ncbi:hypothetical protein [Geomonas agri]|uniref:hypothetical protein n=1 Tax=Geomonas agri TaxID=2873702 RepID=UPI001CD25AA7|nr:hypothetical protein [Geomonas agri]